MKVILTILNLLSISLHPCLFLTDNKYKYWAVNVYPNNHHYFVLNVPRIRQILPTCKSQGAKTSSFSFNKMINIILGSIPSHQSKSSLIYKKTIKESALLVFIWSF